MAREAVEKLAAAEARIHAAEAAQQVKGVRGHHSPTGWEPKS